MTKLDRNKAILKAWKDGFMQSEIAKFLELSDAGVSKILKKLKVKLWYLPLKERNDERVMLIKKVLTCEYQPKGLNDMLFGQVIK